MSPQPSARDRRRSWLFLLLEVLLIVLGVLLGMAANEWRVARGHRQQADQALRQIAGELRFNREQVDGVIEHHQALKDSLALLVGRQDVQGENIGHADLWKALSGGFRYPLIESTAWNLALQTGAVEHMDYGPATGLSRYYNFQSFYSAKLSVISNNVYTAVNMDADSADGLIRALHLLMGDIVINEERLIEQIDVIIPRLDELVPPEEAEPDPAP